MSLRTRVENNKMDGVFVNLTDKAVKITDTLKHKDMIVEGNPDLITPVTKVIFSKVQLSGIVSTLLSDDDIHTIQSAQLFNTVYNKITRMELNVSNLDVNLMSPYYKYPFTKEQIDKINGISNGRTRLFIMTRDDAEFWSSGNFECPFRNYRIFVAVDSGALVEYPIPKTYLDIISSSVGNVTRKFSMW